MTDDVQLCFLPSFHIQHNLLQKQGMDGRMGNKLAASTVSFQRDLRN